MEQFSSMILLGKIDQFLIQVSRIADAAEAIAEAVSQQEEEGSVEEETSFEDENEGLDLSKLDGLKK